MTNLTYAFLLTLFAGLATGIGSAIAFFAKRTNYRFLSVSTGFSAGVMLYVSFVEILAKGSTALTTVYGAKLGNWINVLSFFGGIALIDNLIPSAENPHELPTEEQTAPLHRPSPPNPDTILTPKQVRQAAASALPPAQHSHAQMLRMGLFTALAISIHNFPEGLATFLAALEDPGLGVAIAIAIAIHNIPEGISVAVPIYYATGRRDKAFFYSLLSGMAEFVGAVIAYLLLRVTVGTENGFPPQVMGVLFGGVAGVMVYISLDELLPTSRAYGKGHDSLLGLVAGMVVMALSLLLMM
jgi:ZIP family zinc transporter